MSDSKQRFQSGSQLQSPSGNVYVYLQAGEDLEARTAVAVNHNRRAFIWQNIERDGFIDAQATEDVNKEEWSFFLVRGELENEQRIATVRGGSPTPNSPQHQSAGTH